MNRMRHRVDIPRLRSDVVTGTSFVGDPDGNGVSALIGRTPYQAGTSVPERCNQSANTGLTRS